MEQGVKEAMTVSKTGRREEQRSSYAIVRSHNVLCEDINDDTKIADRINQLMNNGDTAVAKKEALIESIGEEAYKAEFDEAEKLLQGGHYRNERIQGIIDDIMDSADRNKADNVRQKTTGVDLTAENLNVIQYTWLLKKEHTDFLKAELKARGFVAWKHPKNHPKKTKKGKDLTFMELRNELKALEKNRVQEETPDDVNLVKGAEKGFFQHEKNELDFVKAVSKEK